MTRKKTILLTGASRGIGLDIVNTLIKKDYELVVCSRTLSPELKKIISQNSSVEYFKVDLGS